jgi:hypothetical protein
MGTFNLAGLTDDFIADLLCLLKLFRLKIYKAILPITSIRMMKKLCTASLNDLEH